MTDATVMEIVRRALVLAVSISAPVSRVSLTRALKLGALLREQTRAISGSLGWSAGPR